MAVKTKIAYVTGFVWFGRSWYYESVPKDDNSYDTINVGVYSQNGGGTLGEFKFVFCKNDILAGCRMIAWDDSWEVLAAHFPSLLLNISYIAKSITPDTLVEKLKELGITDLTQYERPEGLPAPITKPE